MNCFTGKCFLLGLQVLTNGHHIHICIFDIVKCFNDFIAGFAESQHQSRFCTALSLCLSGILRRLNFYHTLLECGLLRVKRLTVSMLCETTSGATLIISVDIVFQFLENRGLMLSMVMFGFMRLTALLRSQPT